MTNTHWRPGTLDMFTGQSDLVRWLQQEIAASIQQERPVANQIWYGSPGLGKTTLARLVADARQVDSIELLGPNVTAEVLARAFGAFASFQNTPCLSSAGWTSTRESKEGQAVVAIKRVPGVTPRPGILVIDEIDGMNDKLFEMMHHVLEPDGDGHRYYRYKPPGAAGDRRYWVPPFTLIGLTNYEHEIPAPLKRPGRCRMRYEFQPYTVPELRQMVEQLACQIGVAIDSEAVEAIAQRANGSPAAAKDHLTEAQSRLITSGAVSGEDWISLTTVNEALEMLGIDHLGLERVHRDYLQVLAATVSGKLSLPGLAAALNKPAKTITCTVEPPLIRRRMIAVVSGGRQITPAGRVHLVETDPDSQTMAGNFSRAMD